MSLTPGIPNMQASLKSFWARPEGKVGMCLLGLLGLGVVGGLLMFWAAILPFLLAVVGNTMELMAMCALLVGGLYVAFNKNVHCLVGNIFKSTMRALTGVFITIDPIGILRNNIEDMKKKKIELENSIGSVAGSIQSLKSSIAKKQDDIQHKNSLIHQTDAVVAPLQTQLQRLNPNSQEYQELALNIQAKSLNKTAYATTAGMEMKAVDKLNAMLDQTNRIYNVLRRYSNLADFQISTTTQQVDLLAEERKTMMASAKALGAAKDLIDGKPAQVAMIDQTLEYLADSTASTLGDMSNFEEYSRKYLDNMDIEKGAAASDALATLDTYEAKLKKVPSLSAGDTNPIMDYRKTPQGVYAPVGSGSSDDSYNEMFK